MKPAVTCEPSGLNSASTAVACSAGEATNRSVSGSLAGLVSMSGSVGHRAQPIGPGSQPCSDLGHGGFGHPLDETAYLYPRLVARPCLKGDIPASRVGDVACYAVGKHRRITVEALMEYKRRDDQERRA
ncbi:hypothetical protein [Actinoallomurus sp. NPDC050550]|uniref:hypothetical protein n=1 Tax=Actinoallomurus sp. NPDC050550 TaxID=3154937 RepID=UPI0033F09CD2